MTRSTRKNGHRESLDPATTTQYSWDHFVFFGHAPSPTDRLSSCLHSPWFQYTCWWGPFHQSGLSSLHAPTQRPHPPSTLVTCSNILSNACSVPITVNSSAILLSCARFTTHHLLYVLLTPTGTLAPTTSLWSTRTFHPHTASLSSHVFNRLLTQPKLYGQLSYSLSRTDPLPALSSFILTTWQSQNSAWAQHSASPIRPMCCTAFNLTSVNRHFILRLCV